MRLLEGLDTVPVLNALQTQPQLWNAENIRTTYPNTPHREADDILLRFNDTSDPEHIINDITCTNRPALAALPQTRPIIFGLMRQVEGTELGRVIITRLGPGKQIYPHADGGAPVTHYKRYQVSLMANPGVLFRCGDEMWNQRTGEVIWFDNSKEHSVTNNSADDRIALICDIRPCQC